MPDEFREPAWLLIWRLKGQSAGTSLVQTGAALEAAGVQGTLEQVADWCRS